MNRFFVLIVLLIHTTLISSAQTVDVKVNIPAGAVAIFNPSMEVGFASHSAISMDFVGAFARKNWMGTGHPFLLSMGLFGYRYYFKKDVHQGFFLGGDFGLNTFKMNKNIVPLVINDKNNAYDVGYGYVIGSTFGYKYRFNYRWGIETSISYGFHHCQHEGYSNNGNRGKMSASAEWVPYKAGVYLTYRIGNK